MTKYHHRWLNTDKFESLHPKFAKSSKVVINESDYDKISAPVLSNVESVKEFTSENMPSSYTYMKYNTLTYNDLIEVTTELARTMSSHKKNSKVLDSDKF